MELQIDLLDPVAAWEIFLSVCEVQQMYWLVLKESCLQKRKLQTQTINFLFCTATTQTLSMAALAS